MTMIFQNWSIASNKGLWFSGNVGDGEFMRWVDNILVEQDFHRKGKKHGMLKMWFRNGQPKLKGEYVNNHKHGEWTHWFKNGQMEMHCFYESGNLEGEYKQWDMSGDLINHVVYEDGNITKDYLNDKLSN